ncbi:putative two-component system sensor kinase [Rhodococcus sp. RD6.2]|uniref:sensor histidine kinase n=1 Tax=Rhodococcus sp. RD6.2 TaxID=260936 RepID=UPI00063B578D|nr:sensor histidine kinase [Rhodococcus sp. RD6.2]CRK53594.1 putative two-component system sensor kinase [Rhodococcus sp. RD6.2]
MRLRTQVLLLQSGVVAVAVGVGFGFFATTTENRVGDEHGQRALAIARTVAADADVRADVTRFAAADDGVVAPGNEELADSAVQQAAESTRVATGALFVVVTDEKGLRLAHPDPDRLGLRVSTDPTALSGAEVVVRERGTLGDSVRAKVPVIATDSDVVVGEVSVGISTAEVGAELWSDLRWAALVVALALGAGVVGSALLAARWKKLTLGLEPEQLAQLVREQEAVLHGVGEGIVGVDADGMVTVVNADASRLLDLHGGVGERIDEIGLTPRLLELMNNPDDEAIAAAAGDRVVLAMASRVVRDGRDLGTVMSVRDRTDVQNLTRELDSVQAIGAVLRAQQHEFGNRLHLLYGLLSRGDTAAATEFLETLVGSGGVVDELAGAEDIADPNLRAFLIAKAAHARERDVTLVLGENTWIPSPLVHPVDVTTVVGNLVDNAVDAAADGPARPAEVEIDLVEHDGTLIATVGDTGPGLAVDPEEVFREGVTTKPVGDRPGGRGIGLALTRQLARKHGGDVVVGDSGGRRTAENPTGGAVFVATLPGVCEPGGGES